MSYVTKVLLIIGILIFCWFFADSIKAIVLPILGALILAYLINPIIVWMVGKKVPKGAAIIIIYLLIFIFVSILIIFTFPKLSNVMQQMVAEVPKWLDGYKAQIINFVSKTEVNSWSFEYRENVEKWISNGFYYLNNMFINMFSNILKNSLSSVSVIINVFIIFFVAYYAIIDIENVKRTFLWLIPKKWRSVVREVASDANDIIYKYIKGQLFVMVIVGIMYIIIYKIIGLKYAVLLGVLGGISNAIPYIGPYIGGVPAVIVGITSSFKLAMITFIAIIFMQQIDNNFISPRIMKSKLGISPLISILSIIVFGEFFGFIGILLGIPFAAIGILIIRKFIEIRRKDEPDSERYLDKFF